MSFIIDLVIIAIILLCTFIGYKRGLIKIAFSLCTFILALIVALILYQPISNIIIDNTEFDENIENAITSNLLPECVSEEGSEVTSNIPSILLDSGTTTVKEISSTLSIKLIETVVLLLIYIVAKVVLRFVTFLADLIAKLPILNQFNKLGGTVYGVLQGALLVIVCFTVISLISPMLEPEFIDSINNSKIGSFVYNNNILLSFIVK